MADKARFEHLQIRSHTEVKVAVECYLPEKRVESICMWCVRSYGRPLLRWIIWRSLNYSMSFEYPRDDQLFFSSQQPSVYDHRLAKELVSHFHHWVD
ncbi:hypothetical protein R1flu_017877 [Riccia fluitans]|uniref:Uncharacterized protein n=1 Tax=Riccia fluitans TaxID=41844 RepID=A0ABD1ZHM4_9MARC